MRLFKTNNISKKDWSNVTLKQYYKIKEMIEQQDPYTFLNIIDELWGVDSSKLPAMELEKYISKLSFLKSELPTCILKKHYKINNTDYDSNCDLTTMSTAQFIDYQNYLPNQRYEQLLSVFFIPSGHSYNDGYDISKVQEDLLDLPMEVVNAAAFFFKIQLKIYCKVFQRYLIRTMKKNNVAKEAITQFKKLDLNFLVSYPTYLLTVMQQMKPYQQPSNNQ